MALAGSSAVHRAVPWSDRLPHRTAFRHPWHRYRILHLRRLRSVGWQIVTRQNGSMVCDRKGIATPYAMQRLQARGNFFVEPQSPVYEGQVVGVNNKPDELDVNITLAKHMTNMRSSTADVLETLTPPIKMSLEESLDFANEDECVEVTPESIRVRKIILSVRIGTSGAPSSVDRITLRITSDSSRCSVGFASTVVCLLTSPTVSPLGSPFDGSAE